LRTSKKPAAPPTAARRAVHKLREIVLARPAGAYLGSEEEMAGMLGVGRATLRQTARLLEHEHLLLVKRGVRGGYYGHRPDSRAVMGAAATYLRVHNPTFLDLFAAARSLNIELARLAASASPEADRRPLSQVAANMARKGLDAKEVQAVELDLREALYRLAANPFLELILRVHTEICLKEFRTPVLDSEERTEEYRKNRLAVANAVLDGDEEFAAIHARRGNEMVHRWVAAREGQPLRHVADQDYWRGAAHEVAGA
jgi:DNA-binding FadR family transcriptional regulator